MTMSVADIAAMFFESEQVRTVMTLNGLIGTWAGPYEPGTGYVMAHHSIGDVGDGHLGAWAVPEGGMGAVADGAAALGRVVRRPHPDEREGRARPGARRARVGVALTSGEEIEAPLVRHGHPPEDHVPAAARAPRAARRLRARHRGVEVALGRGQDQLRAVEAPAVHRHARAHRPVRRHGAGALGGVPGDGLRGGAPRRPGHPAVLRRDHPDGLRPVARARGRPHRVAVHAVGAARVVGEAAQRGAGGVRRPRHRRLRRAGAGLPRVGDRAAGHRAVRDGTGVRPDRRQHLPRRAVGRAAVPHAPRARIRGLPDADSRSVPMLFGDARRRRRHRHPRLQLRPRDPARPARGERRRPLPSSGGGTR